MPRVVLASACSRRPRPGCAAKAAKAPSPSRPCAKRLVSSRSFCAAASRNGAVSSLRVSPPAGSPAAPPWCAADESALLRAARTSEPPAPDLPSAPFPNEKRHDALVKRRAALFFLEKADPARAHDGISPSRARGRKRFDYFAGEGAAAGAAPVFGAATPGGGGGTYPFGWVATHCSQAGISSCETASCCMICASDHPCIFSS